MRSMSEDITSEVPDEDVEISRFYTNIERILELLNFYAKNQLEPKIVLDDVLRSIVIFIHASIEDYIRNIVLRYYIHAPSEAWDKFHLPDKAGKVSFREIAMHRGKSINDYLLECVKAQMEQQSFNDMTEISKWLLRIGLTIDKNWAPLFGTLDEMIERRHQIVHRADLDDKHQATPIDISDVHDWADAALDFWQIISEAILAQLGKFDVTELSSSKLVIKDTAEKETRFRFDLTERNQQPPKT